LGELLALKGEPLLPGRARQERRHREASRGERLEWYWGVSGELHAHCDDALLWTVLSGRPPAFSSSSPDDPCDQPEWIKVSDLGAVTDPPMGTSTVLAKLRRTGYLERVDGKDQPTERARGHFIERPVDVHSSRYPVREGAVQRLWSYDVLIEPRATAGD